MNWLSITINQYPAPLTVLKLAQFELGVCECRYDMFKLAYDGECINRVLTAVSQFTIQFKC